MVKELIDFMQRTISNDFTSQSQFLGDFDRWCESRIRKGKIQLISGIDVGVRNVDDEAILLEDLMSQHYLKLYQGTYGIWIPASEILSRRKYEWFARMSQKQVLESDTILGKYMLVYNSPDTVSGSLLEPMKNKPNWVGFWKVPEYPGLYGLKPNFLGDNLSKITYTGR